MIGFNNSKIQRAYLRSVREAHNLTRPKAILERGSLHPFKRAAELYTAIMECRAANQGALFELQQKLAEFPPYVSRGHGWKGRVKNRLIGAKWSEDRSKYSPHQGRSESARRAFWRLSPAQQVYVRGIEAEVMQDEDRRELEVGL